MSLCEYGPSSLSIYNKYHLSECQRFPSQYMQKTACFFLQKDIKQEKENISFGFVLLQLMGLILDFDSVHFKSDFLYSVSLQRMSCQGTLQAISTPANKKVPVEMEFIKC